MRITPPPVDPIQKHEIKTDFEVFVKAYFNVELTSEQIEVVRAVLRGQQIRVRRRMGITTINEWIKAYMAAGVSTHGRERMPTRQIAPPVDLKGKSQEAKILELIKRPGGAFNYELSRYALKYTSVISELRKDGEEIVAERQYLKNGKASNTWKYYIAGNL